MATFEKVFVRGKPRKEVPDWKRWKHTGGGAAARRGGGGGGRRPPTAEERAKYEAWHREQFELEEALGRLRGLPAEPEEDIPGGTRYRVACDSAPCRLAPSLSAGAVGAPLRAGDVCDVVARRGQWVRLERDHLPADGAPLPRWVLTRHPKDGVLLRAA